MNKHEHVGVEADFKRINWLGEKVTGHRSVPVELIIHINSLFVGKNADIPKNIDSYRILG